MTKCDDCNLTMHGSITCDHPYIQLGSKVYKRNTYDFDTNRDCHDCGISNNAGNVHHAGCDMERCPKCKGQLLSCGCQYCECDDSCGDWYSEGCDKDHAGLTLKQRPNNMEMKDVVTELEELREKYHTQVMAYPKTPEYYQQLEKNYGKALDEISKYQEEIKKFDEKCDIMLKLLKME